MKKHRLPKMCPTRFVERHTTLERFVEQLPAVVEVLRHSETWTDPATSTKAGLLLNGLLKSEVMVGLFVLLKASCILLPPSRALQEKGADLVAAVQLLDRVLEELGRLRQDNAEFSRIFLEAEDAMMAAVGTKIRRPRVSKEKKNAHRASASTSTSATGESNDSPEEYFRVNLFAPALDHLLVDIKARFGEQQRKAMTLTNLVSSRVLNASWGDVQPAWRKYGHLVPVTERQAEAELVVWRGMCSRMPPEERPWTAIESLRRCPCDAFPATSRLLMILATLPVSTAEAERMFSKLDRTLSATRSTMTESRLEALVLMQAFRGELPAAAEVVNRLLKLPGKRCA
ncbi:repressor of the inhibitor of the protein kinase [Amphibalanus amphitrite]|uniref:Repressor of the inhibitor of the protein kinase n=1 Tax=Amphibalanus amphitrite TaxID=1232801 RepID=A0A6A4WQ04_AMPAM|nr:repressor of the inhibitor of the protein kinase [Amphibalanus amphitrite]